MLRISKEELFGEFDIDQLGKKLDSLSQREKELEETTIGEDNVKEREMDFEKKVCAVEKKKQAVLSEKNKEQDIFNWKEREEKGNEMSETDV